MRSRYAETRARQAFSERRCLTVAEVAAEIGYERKKVIRLLASGELAGFRLGDGPKARWRIERADLERFIRERKEDVRRDVAAAVPRRSSPLRLLLCALVLCIGASTARADDAAIIHDAWLKASSLVGAGDALPVPPVRFVEPRRYVRLQGQPFTRLCGETMDFEGSRIVFIYTAPDENALAFNTLVHEFLHVLDSALGLRKNGEDPEAWVRSLWPADCPTEAGRSR